MKRKSKLFKNNDRDDTSYIDHKSYMNLKNFKLNKMNEIDNCEESDESQKSSNQSDVSDLDINDDYTSQKLNKNFELSEKNLIKE